MKKVIWLIVLCFLTLPVYAVQLADIFSDHMVFQQGKPVNIWGTGESGESVTVIFNSQIAKTTVDSNNNWQIKLSSMKANATPNKLIVIGKNRLEIMDVLVGEVWFCSGQSNMVLTLSQIEVSSEELSFLNYPQIRMNSLEKKGWEVCAPESVKIFSGTAFYFGKNLYERLKVPVGLLVRAGSGSFIEPWMSREACLSNATTKTYLEKAETPEIRNVLMEYDKACQVYYKERKEWEKATPEEQKSMTNPKPPARPATYLDWWGFLQVGFFHNLLVKPVIPYTIRGFLWYQGETNAFLKSAAIRYRDILPVLIQDWRKDWGDNNLPFYLVQLPNWPNPQGKFWPWMRESQYVASQVVPNTGMAVTVDIGGAELHAKNKKEVGRRLALIALANTYGVKTVYSGPIFKSMKIQDNKAIFQFSSIGSGLMAKGGVLKGFEVAGKDKVFIPAQAEIQGEQVIVQDSQVKNVVAVRYGWAPDPDCTLYNEDGLPAMPFRTDSWNE